MPFKVHGHSRNAFDNLRRDMPLVKGKSPEAFEKNLKTEMHAGKPQKQSLAIAYAIKRRSQQKKAAGGHVHGPECAAEGCMMAEGGQLTKSGYQDPDQTKTRPDLSYHEMDNISVAPDTDPDTRLGGPDHTYAGHQSPRKEDTRPDLGYHEKDNLSLDHLSDEDKRNAAAMAEADRRLGQHGAHEEGPQGTAYAKGGYAKTWGVPTAGTPIHMADQHKIDEEALKKELHYAAGGETLPYDDEELKRDLRGYALGGTMPYDDSEDETQGDAGSGHEGSFNEDNYSDTEDGDGQDMVGRIMKQRQQSFSEGGKVANYDHGQTDTDVDDSDEYDKGLAGFHCNEFDDLAMRDDLSHTYTEANSGDDLGNARTEHDEEDDVARIMRLRQQRSQRNPGTIPK
jgi:hypothetical protein